MIEWRGWLAANRPLGLFVYGLAFFVMGLAIVLQSRRYSWLELARSLSRLAARRSAATAARSRHAR